MHCRPPDQVYDVIDRILEQGMREFIGKAIRKRQSPGMSI